MFRLLFRNETNIQSGSRFGEKVSYYYRKTRNGDKVTSEYIHPDQAPTTTHLDKKLKLEQHLSEIITARKTNHYQNQAKCQEALLEAILIATDQLLTQHLQAKGYKKRKGKWRRACTNSPSEPKSS